MQPKKTNKILIIAVALIWGIVLYKFATPYFTTTETVLTAQSLVKPLQTIVRKKDTFKLKKLQRDPFLGKIYKEKSKSKSPIRKQSATPKKGILKNWPNIIYLGYVKANKSSKKLGLLRVNNVMKRVNKNEIVEDIKIKSISASKITIQFQNEIRDFQKN